MLPTGTWLSRCPPAPGLALRRPRRHLGCPGSRWTLPHFSLLPAPALLLGGAHPCEPEAPAPPSLSPHTPTAQPPPPRPRAPAPCIRGPAQRLRGCLMQRATRAAGLSRGRGTDRKKPQSQAAQRRAASSPPHPGQSPGLGAARGCRAVGGAAPAGRVALCPGGQASSRHAAERPPQDQEGQPPTARGWAGGPCPSAWAPEPWCPQAQAQVQRRPRPCLVPALPCHSPAV